jgi:hypothetical protein
MTKATKFWAVWRGLGGGAPNKRHATRDDAIREAARLARQSNEPYYVLETIGIVEPVEVPVNFTELGNDP